MAWGMAAAAGVSALGSIIGGKMQANAAADAEKNFLKVAKYNAESAAKENAIQRAFAEKLLQMSRPQMSPDELGDLLFAQGQGAYNDQSNKMLQATLRNNLRQGMPTSNTSILSSFADRAATSMGDRRSDATLKGITGTLPGAAAIQAASNLYTPAAVPQMAAPGPNYVPGNALMGVAGTLSGLLAQYGGKGGTKTGVGDQGSPANATYRLGLY